MVTRPPSIHDCTIWELPRIMDPRGSLTPVQSHLHIPFEIKRIFYLYDVPTAECRGAHAHKKLLQFLICISGSFDVELDDGTEKKTVHLNRPWQGLLVHPMVWAAEVNFDQGSICLVLASEDYEENDYLRDYQEFLDFRSQNQ